MEKNHECGCENHSGNGIKVAVLQTKQEENEKFIRDMKENHLPHLYERLGLVETSLGVVHTDIGWLKTWGIGILAIIQLIISFGVSIGIAFFFK